MDEESDFENGLGRESSSNKYNIEVEKLEVGKLNNEQRKKFNELILKYK